MTWKAFRIAGILWGNPPVTDRFQSWRASNDDVYCVAGPNELSKTSRVSRDLERHDGYVTSLIIYTLHAEMITTVRIINILGTKKMKAI